MHTVHFALLLTAALPSAKDQDPEPVQKAVVRSLDFLEKDAVAWVKKQKCATCHHVPMMVWSLNEAKHHGYQINDKSLAEVTEWALVAKNHNSVFPELPLDKNKSETDFLGPLNLALGLGAIRNPNAAQSAARQRLLKHTLSRQEADGSWNANSGGRPPVHSTPYAMTAWLLLALPAPAANTADPFKNQRDKAAAWLNKADLPDDDQSLLLRLLVLYRLGQQPEEQQRLRQRLLGRQNADGGWQQANGMDSDAFATGLALYVLSHVKADDVRHPLLRARDFLVKTQQPDGSWIMKSRSAPAPGPGPARYLTPIRFWGTAWATIGLVQRVPK
jgi:squalene-hopene/tetraprenyl-beta-curcumene cyclase